MWDFLVIFGAKYLVFFLFLPLSLLWARGERELVKKAVLSAILAEGIALLVGYLFPTPRPFAALGQSPLPIFFIMPPSGISFPSGHASFSAALVTSLILGEKSWGTLLLVLVLAIGASRVLALAHFWWDILGGYAVGVFSAFLIKNFWKYLEMGRFLPRSR